MTEKRSRQSDRDGNQRKWDSGGSKQVDEWDCGVISGLLNATQLLFLLNSKFTTFGEKVAEK
jgi:hypothetical protein